MKEILLKLRTLLIVLVIVGTVLSAGAGILTLLVYLDQINEVFGFGLLALFFISIFAHFIFKQNKFSASSQNENRKALLKEKIFNSIRRGR